MTGLDFDETLARGVAAHEARRLAEALAIYRSALAMAPADPEANSLMGLALAQSDRAAEARRYLLHAVNLHPEIVGYRMNLVEGLIAAREFAEARRELRSVLSRSPQHARAQDRLGDVAALEGDERAAIEAWRRAKDADAHYLPPALKLARLAAGNNRFAEAEAIIQEISAVTPDHPAIHALRCEFAAARREWSRLSELANAWCARQPKVGDAWRYAARASVELGQLPKAIEAYRRVGQIVGPNLADLVAFAGLLLQLNDFNGAWSALLAAEKIDRNSPELLAQRALLHAQLGQYAEAEACCRACLTAAPDFMTALGLLAKLRRGDISETELATVLSVARRPDATPEVAIPAAITGAQALEVRGDFFGAFQALARAHEVALARDAADGRVFDRAAEVLRIGQIESAFATARAAGGDAPVDAGVAAGASRPRPLFLVGMPWSGAASIEALLATHPGIVNCAEHATLMPILQSRIALGEAGLEPRPHTLDEWRAAYRAVLPRAQGVAAIIDKHPFNYLAVGLIDRLFPDAVIVHVSRDPLETCLAIWRNEAPRSWTFAHRFEDLATMYANYGRIMAHWERLLPGRVMTVRHEAFITGPRDVAVDILAACDVTADEDWLTRWSSPAVAPAVPATEPGRGAGGTARGPVIDLTPRARDYAEHVAPLAAALAAAGVR